MAEDYDEIEMEFDPDSILYYFVDPQGNELGLCVRDEHGKKQEYWYPEDAIERFYLIPEKKPSAGLAQSKGHSDQPVTKDEWRGMMNTFKDLANEGYTGMKSAMDQVDDLNTKLDEINPELRYQKYVAQKENEVAAAKMLAADEQERAALAEYDAAWRMRKAREAVELEEQKLKERAEAAAAKAAEATPAKTAEVAPAKAAEVAQPEETAASEISLEKQAIAEAEAPAETLPVEPGEPKVLAAQDVSIAPTGVVGHKVSLKDLKISGTATVVPGESEPESDPEPVNPEDLFADDVFE